jgi:hypothetical protein
VVLGGGIGANGAVLSGALAVGLEDALESVFVNRRVAGRA